MLLLLFLLAISSFTTTDAGPWGKSGKPYDKPKKSDAKLEDDMMDGSTSKYDDPTKPPDWLLAPKLLDPGLPTTPPPPPTMMLPPPQYDDNDMDLDGKSTDESSYLRGQGYQKGPYNPPAFG